MLGENGVCVVSGMARGIDICAHLGALEGKGDTIAVLGNGTDVPYPANKAFVYEQICRDGLAVSEYVPGTQPAPGNFPARNRIISGLAQGVVVVEAGEKSGTNITVNYALEGSAFIAGAAIQWLRDGLGLIQSAGEVEALAAQVEDSGGIGQKGQRRHRDAANDRRVGFQTVVHRLSGPDGLMSGHLPLRYSAGPFWRRPASSRSHLRWWR